MMRRRHGEENQEEDSNDTASSALSGDDAVAMISFRSPSTVYLYYIATSLILLAFIVNISSRYRLWVNYKRERKALAVFSQCQSKVVWGRRVIAVTIMRCRRLASTSDRPDTFLICINLGIGTRNLWKKQPPTFDSTCGENKSASFMNMTRP